jgi:D-alanyl-lipoteichoic acid acyltransferase DltB (MBOAT superfamily)
MSFVSWHYALFLPLVLAFYWRLPHRGRILLLIAASYTFYGCWDARFLALLLVSTVTDFVCAQAIAGQRLALARVFGLSCLPLVWAASSHAVAMAVSGIAGEPQPALGRVFQTVSPEAFTALALFPVLFAAGCSLLWRGPEARRRTSFLLLSLGTNLALLGFFKYYNFFTDSAAAMLGLVGVQPGWTLLHIILPVGISFYTFQTLSYTVDVYRQRLAPTGDFITYATYLSFFPQLVAGPIERSTALLPQLQTPSAWDAGNFHRGLRLILIGLFKKVFVADNCALLAGYVFDDNPPLNAPWALLGVTAFAFQIYGDFSGYSDIARGSARLFGIHLSHNFHFPYFATGPSDFWQRWHITLSSWFRDYVYIPLGGNRGGAGRTLVNLLATMLLAGLWHGANWTFVLWGAYHGLLLIAYRLCNPLSALERNDARAPWRTASAVALMFGFTLIGWVIFRSQSPAQMAAWFMALPNWASTGTLDWVRPFWWLLFHSLPLLALQAATWKDRDEVEMLRWPWPVRGVVYGLLFLAVASSTAGEPEFIYFQF